MASSLPWSARRWAGSGPMNPLRLERLLYGIRLFDLAAATKGGVSSRKLSMAERGLRHLTADEEAARRTALARLKGP